MLSEGLRQELPELFDLWARRPRLVVPRMHPVLAALAGLGSQWLSLAIVQGALLLSSSLTGFPGVATFGFSGVASWALAAIVAFASGGRQGVALLAVAAIALEVTQLAVRLPAAAAFCEHAGGVNCPTLLGSVAASWPMAAGLVIGLIARRTISAGGTGVLALPVGAGLNAAVTALTSYSIVIFVPREFAGPRPAAFDWHVGAEIAGAAAMGFIAGRFGARPALAAAVISAAYLLRFAGFLRAIIENPPTNEIPWQVWTPVLFTLAAMLGLAFGGLSRAARMRE